MTAREPSRSDDETILAMLDLSANEGLGMTAIAQRFGATKNAVAGKFHRVRREEVLDCKCRKAANKDGGMPRFWWMK